MNILHVVQAYTPAIGGTELLIQNISERLVADYGDSVTVFTTTAAKNCELFWSPAAPKLPPGPETINGVTVHRFPVISRGGHTRRLLSQWADTWRLPGGDWAHLAFVGPLSPGLARATARFPAEVVAASSFPFLHMHHALRNPAPTVLHGALHPSDTWSFDRRPLYRAIERATAYLANSPFERDYLVERGLAGDKIHVIGVGVDPAPFARADGCRLRREYGWGDSPVIGYVGHLARRKRVTHLLEAMQGVWREYPQAKLLLAGTSQADYVRHLRASLPAGRGAIRPDFPDHDKPDIFAACDVLVQPSIEESFGLVFLEAWACRKPVIGMDTGAMPTIISAGQDGLLAAPPDPAALTQAITTLLDQPAYRAELGQAGYDKMYQHYTWDVVTAKFRQVYSKAKAKTV